MKAESEHFKLFRNNILTQINFWEHICKVLSKKKNYPAQSYYDKLAGIYESENKGKKATLSNVIEYLFQHPEKEGVAEEIYNAVKNYLKI